MNEQKYEYFKDYPDLMTTEEIQSALRIGRNKAYELIKGKAIASIKIGSQIRVRKPDLISFVNNPENGYSVVVNV